MENKSDMNQQAENNDNVMDEQETVDRGLDQQEAGKKVYRKVAGEGSSVTPQSIKEKNKQTIQDIIIGLIVLVSSYSLMFFLINQSVAWLLIIIILIIIINGIIVVRGFRRKRIILAAFGLVFLGPVVFFMLVLGACGLLYSGF